MTGKRALRGSEPLSGHGSTAAPYCPLCGRVLVSGPSVDEHHLLPRSQGGKQAYLIHRICHRKIHATFSEKELARQFHTWEALRSHEAIAAFIVWVRKKPAEFYDNSRRASNRL